MNQARRTFSASELAAFSDEFVAEYRVKLIPGQKGGDDPPLFFGAHQVRRLPAGLTLDISELTAICDSNHAGSLKRSLTIALALDGAPIDLNFGNGHSIMLEQGQIVMVGVSDTRTITGIHRAGETSRCILLQTRPENLEDPELAEKVDGVINSTAIKRLASLHSASAWARTLFASSVDQPIGRLIAESCSLGLLAQCLMSLSGSDDSLSPSLNHTDRRRMLRVRDKLIAAPERPHCLGSLAREAGVSVTTLKTKFHAVFGQSVFAYLRDLRLERARNGIEQEGWTVSQAAYSVGYQHLSSFSDAFRRKFGTTPSHIRRQARTTPWSL